MPQVFCCSECHLLFHVDWFHGWNDVNYPAHNYLVCKHCGTMQIIHFGKTKLSSRIRTLLNYCKLAPILPIDIPDTIDVREKPIFINTNNSRFDCFKPVIEGWEKTKITGEIRKRRTAYFIFSLLEGSRDPLNFAFLECEYCNKTGSLERKWRKEDTLCPNCKRNSLSRFKNYVT